MINMIDTRQGKIESIVVDVRGMAIELTAIKIEGISIAGTKGYIYFIPTEETF